MHRRSAMKRLLALAAVFALALGFFTPFASADAPAAAPLTAGSARNGMVRVRLSSLGAPAVLNLTVYGSYTVNGQSEKQIASGSKVTVRYDKASGALSLTCGGVTANMGASFKLRRHAADGQNGVKIAQGRVPGNLYPGDFLFTVRNGTYYIIAYVYMEDYLCGVLPYEMGASSPLEALKAQAIAARTYTMRAMQHASSTLYDVVDTTQDQVYSGTPSASTACTQAVNATKGIALQSGSSFAATYYTASNGGQTESIKNIWGTSGYAYLSVKDDPYDLQNPDARKTSFFVSASGVQQNAKLQSLLARKAASAFGAEAVLTGVTAVTPHTPKYPAPSKLYTKLDFSVTYQKDGGSRAGVLTFNIFSELEGPLGMSINSGKNELWSVSPAVGGFTVNARRYGHGLGMSQRGAMQMAKMGYSCAQILGFYFAGCTQVQYSLTRSILSPVVSGQESREQVTAETPAPIETDAPAQGEILARVNTQKGSLNLRVSPSSSARVLRTIPQYEVISVLEKGDSWCKSVYGGTEGYVMTAFLSFQAGPAGASPTPDAASPTPTPTPSATSAESAPLARVNTQKGSLNLRVSPSSSARVLRTIPQYEVISVLEKGDSWCKTVYGGTEGYVMTAFLTFQAGPAGASPTPIAASPTQAPSATPAPSAATAWVNTPQGSLNLRLYARDTAKVLLTIPQYETVSVHETGSVWCRVTYHGVTGWAMTRFLSFDGAAPTPAPAPIAPSPTPAVTPVPAPSAATAWVNTPQGSLNLRLYARDTAKVLLTIPQYETVSVHETGSVWCRVTYRGVTGWVMTRFLSFNGAAPTPAPAGSPAPAAGGSVPLDPTLRTLREPIVGRIMPTDKRLNLREGCSTAARVILEMPKYEFLTIYAVGDTWCQVEYGGRTGYCMTKYLEYRLYE
ncbi:MAG: SpoIID/LytB domain-containing protein [Clostridiales bacterium]|nr:SpoIID/LytB domain-containing protein [Clostridiales bacterium]